MTIPGTAICAAMDRILEEMYFRAGVWDGVGTLESSTIGARVTFSGSVCGEFKVLATERFAAELAADFLAADFSEITAAQAVSLVQEFANVACCATLSEWMPDASFNFSVPCNLGEEELRGSWPYRFSTGEAGPEIAPQLAVDLIVRPPA